MPPVSVNKPLESNRGASLGNASPIIADTQGSGGLLFVAWTVSSETRWLSPRCLQQFRRRPARASRHSASLHVSSAVTSLCTRSSSSVYPWGGCGSTIRRQLSANRALWRRPATAIPRGGPTDICKNLICQHRKRLTTSHGTGWRRIPIPFANRADSLVATWRTWRWHVSARS